MMTNATATTDITPADILSHISIAELAEIERTYGMRLQLPARVRRQLDAYYDQPRPLALMQ